MYNFLNIYTFKSAIKYKERYEILKENFQKALENAQQIISRKRVNKLLN